MDVKPLQEDHTQVLKKMILQYEYIFISVSCSVVVVLIDSPMVPKLVGGFG